jgi:hypothetical protein
MERVQVRGIALTNASVHDATWLMQEAAEAISTNYLAFIDPVDYLTIPGAEGRNPFAPPHPIPDRTVTITAESMSYLDLLEEICRQTDREWIIYRSGVLLQYRDEEVEQPDGAVTQESAPSAAP